MKRFKVGDIVRNKFNKEDKWTVTAVHSIYGIYTLQQKDYSLIPMIVTKIYGPLETYELFEVNVSDVLKEL